MVPASAVFSSWTYSTAYGVPEAGAGDGAAWAGKHCRQAGQATASRRQPCACMCALLLCASSARKLRLLPTNIGAIRGHRAIRCVRVEVILSVHGDLHGCIRSFAVRKRAHLPATLRRASALHPGQR